MPRRKPATPTTRAERERHWLQHLQAAEAQRVTLTAYAKAEQLDVRQLYHWKRVLGERGLLKRSSASKARSDFVAVTAPQPTLPVGTASPILTVKLACGAELQFHRPLDPGQLKTLLHALGARR